MPVKITDGKITVDKDYPENDDPYMTALSIGDVDVVEADTGNTILVPVSISYSPKFSTIGMNIKYDKKIESVSVEGYWDFDSDILYGDKYISIKYSESEDKDLNGTIFYLRVKLPENAKANDVYNISAEITEFANAAGENIKAKTSDGKITVRETLKPTNVTYNHSNDKETVIEVGNVKISKEDAGKIIEVPVSIFNNPGFAGSAIGYIFDKKIKSLDVEEGMIRDTSDSSGPVTSSVDGYIAVVNTDKYDIKSDGVLYYLKLRLPETVKAGDVYNISAEMNQFCSADGENVEAKIYGGSITIIDNNKTTDVTTTTVPTTTTTTTSTKFFGDLNGDKSIDSKDAVLVLKSYAESLVNSNATVDLSGDVNGDKKVDSKDAVTILKYYAATLTGFKGKISEFI